MPTPRTRATRDAISAFVERALAHPFDLERYVARRAVDLGPWPGPPARAALIEDLRRAAAIEDVRRAAPSAEGGVLAEALHGVVDASAHAPLRVEAAALLDRLDDARALAASAGVRRRRRLRAVLVGLLVVLVGYGVAATLVGQMLEHTPEAGRSGGPLHRPGRPIVHPGLGLTAFAEGWAAWAPPRVLDVGQVEVVTVHLGLDGPGTGTPDAGARPEEAAALDLTAIMKVELSGLEDRVEVRAETPLEQPIGPRGTRWAFRVRGIEAGAERLRLVIVARVEVEGRALDREVGTFEQALVVRAAPVDPPARSRALDAPARPEVDAPLGSRPRLASGIPWGWAVPLLLGLGALAVIGWRRARRRPPPVILLLFANAGRRSEQYLRNLLHERKQIDAALADAVEHRRCRLVVEPDAGVDDLVELVGRHREQLVGLHYAGHGVDGALLLEGEDGALSKALADGLAMALADAPRLRFVFFNACETNSLIDAVHARLDAPIIATDGAIADDVAARFAQRFYASLGSGSSIGVAYRQAEASLRLRIEAPTEAMRSGDRRLSAPREVRPAARPWPWRLVQHPRAADAVSWSLRDG